MRTGNGEVTGDPFKQVHESPQHKMGIEQSQGLGRPRPAVEPVVIGNDTIFTQGLVVRMDLLTVPQSIGEYLCIAPDVLYLVEDDCGNLGILTPGNAYIEWYHGTKDDVSCVKAHIDSMERALAELTAIDQEDDNGE